MNSERILYKQENLFTSIHIFEDEEVIRILEKNYGALQDCRFHKSHLKPATKFSRVYHLGPIITSLVVSSLSILLLVKKWHTNEWTFYLGAIPLIIVIIGYLYYLVNGMNYGEVEFNYEDEKNHLYMKKKEYDLFRTKLDTLC